MRLRVPGADGSHSSLLQIDLGRLGEPQAVLEKLRAKIMKWFFAGNCWLQGKMLRRKRDFTSNFSDGISRG